MKDIEYINYPVPKQEYKVLVRCMTYNQSNYIEDALNGFAMQQTNFPFVCLVMDDASTDGEQEVIKTWMERECDMNMLEMVDIPTSIVFMVPHKTNTSCTFAFYLLKQNLYKSKEEKIRYITPWRENCEYEALCEGDDYWIDSFKLQKQVDFLDGNPEYGMCYTQCKYYYQTKEKFAASAWGGKSLTFEELFMKNTVPTATVIFRVYLINKYNNIIKPQDKKWKLGDYPFWLYISKESKIHFLNEVTTVYRVLEESASHSILFGPSDAYIKSVYDMKSFISEYYKYDCDLNDYKYKSLALNAFRLNRRLEVIEYLNSINKQSFGVRLLKFVAKYHIVFNIVSNVYYRRSVVR